MYSEKIIVHLFPWFPWQNQVYESSMMDLEKYEYNFHFPFIFLFDQSPLYNRTWTLREATALVFHKLLVFRICKHNANTIIQGVKLIFFSDSHLAPKLFKVVANSKKVGLI